MNCPNCGSVINPGETFCRNCGSNVNTQNFNNGFQNGYPNQMNNGQMPQNNQWFGMPSSNQDADLIYAYIGENVEKFINVNGMSKFSWCAFLFGPAYAFYRKLWFFGVAYLGLYIVLSIMLPYFPLVLSLALSIIAGVLFKGLYVKNVESKVQEIKRNNPNISRQQLSAICAQNGGTSFLGPIILLALACILVFTGLLKINFVANPNENNNSADNQTNTNENVNNITEDSSNNDNTSLDNNSTATEEIEDNTANSYTGTGENIVGSLYADMTNYAVVNGAKSSTYSLYALSSDTTCFVEARVRSGYSSVDNYLKFSTNIKSKNIKRINGNTWTVVQKGTDDNENYFIYKNSQLYQIIFYKISTCNYSSVINSLGFK